MKRSKALRIYFLIRPKSRQIVSWLMKWNTKKTVKENASILGVRKNTVNLFAILHKLNYKGKRGKIAKYQHWKSKD
jgi:hypothetical protein